jgi:exonuclease SbcC
MKNLFSSFKTPAWEQRDPELRAVAVRDESAPELIDKLPEIAAQDPEPAVRRAALGRISVPALLLERQRNDTDAVTRVAAMTRLTRLLLDPVAGLAPGARLSAIGLELPNDLLEKVAESAPEVEARRAALTRVSRAGFLLRRCIDESDAGLRELLLERIEGEEALDRVAESLRKRDKTLSRRARDRADALRLARGDADALQRHAMALCDTLTAWAQSLPEDVEQRLERLQQDWSAHREKVDSPLQARVDAYATRVRDAIARREQRAVERDAPPPAVPDAGPEAVAPIAMQGEAAYPAEVAPAETPPAAAVPKGPDWSEFDRVLGDAHRAAVAKHLGDAKPALQRAQALLAGLPKPDRARRDRLSETEQKIDELDQWQRWSGNRVRARLCDEMEAFLATSHHPYAVANRVRELQQEWAKIEAAEPGDADRTSGLARRFRALCGRAMAPTKPYFEQRHALREQRREAVEAKLGEAAPEALAALSVPATIGLRRQLMEALRTLDELEPKARTPLARRLREALGRIDARLASEREDAALGRRKLIAKLRRELTHADPATALALARDAQQQWKTMPRATREQEPELEAELKALIDPLFAREREQREQTSAEAGRVAAESRRILEELGTLAQGGADALSHAEGRIATLQAAWRELHANDAAREREAGRDSGRGPGLRDAGRGAGRDGARGAGARDAGRAGHGAGRGPRDAGGPGSRDARGPRGADRGDARGAPRDARARDPGRGDRREGGFDGRRGGARGNDGERAFDQAVAQVRQAQSALESSRRGARLQAIADAAELIAAVAYDTLGNDDASTRWNDLALDDADRRRLLPRWQQAQSRDAFTRAHDAAQHAAEIWLVEAELDAGLDSPSDAQPLRRQRQMQRLATRLQGAVSTGVDLRERMLQWAALEPLPPETVAAFQARVRAVLQKWGAG